jgi:hypothetical protein
MATLFERPINILNIDSFSLIYAILQNLGKSACLP